MIEIPDAEFIELCRLCRQIINEQNELARRIIMLPAPAYRPTNTRLTTFRDIARTGTPHVPRSGRKSVSAAQPKSRPIARSRSLRRP